MACSKAIEVPVSCTRGVKVLIISGIFRCIKTYHEIDVNGKLGEFDTKILDQTSLIFGGSLLEMLLHF